MELFKKIPMTFEDKEYEIRILYDDSRINVVAFFNNHPANGYRHQIILPKKCNVRRILEKDAVTRLVEVSKDDITRKHWEEFSKVFNTNTASNA